MANADQIKSGDVVILKSGGPEMTINLVYDNGFIDCYWFVPPDFSELKNLAFPPNLLEKVDE